MPGKQTRCVEELGLGMNGCFSVLITLRLLISYIGDMDPEAKASHMTLALTPLYTELMGRGGRSVCLMPRKDTGKHFRELRMRCKGAADRRKLSTLESESPAAQRKTLGSRKYWRWIKGIQG